MIGTVRKYLGELGSAHQLVETPPPQFSSVHKLEI